MERSIDFCQKAAFPFKDKNSIFITKKKGGGGVKDLYNLKRNQSLNSH